jgi:hypothetical protein
MKPIIRIVQHIFSSELIGETPRHDDDEGSEVMAMPGGLGHIPQGKLDELDQGPLIFHRASEKLVHSDSVFPLSVCKPKCRFQAMRHIGKPGFPSLASKNADKMPRHI